MTAKPGFRLGVYVFKDAEIVDYAAPYGVFSVARRLDPALDAFLIAESLRPVQTQAGFTVLPNYGFLIPGGFGTRQETVRPEGAEHQWREDPPRELSVDLVADERGGRVTGRLEAS
jgi:hypothetical protein